MVLGNRRCVSPRVALAGARKSRYQCTAMPWTYLAASGSASTFTGKGKEGTGPLNLGPARKVLEVAPGPEKWAVGCRQLEGLQVTTWGPLGPWRSRGGQPPGEPPGHLALGQGILGTKSWGREDTLGASHLDARFGGHRDTPGGPGPYHLGPVRQQQALVIQYEQTGVAVRTVGKGRTQVPGDEVSLVFGGEAQALEGVPTEQPCRGLVLRRHCPEP